MTGEVSHLSSTKPSVYLRPRSLSRSYPHKWITFAPKSHSLHGCTGYYSLSPTQWPLPWNYPPFPSIGDVSSSRSLSSSEESPALKNKSLNHVGNKRYQSPFLVIYPNNMTGISHAQTPSPPPLLVKDTHLQEREWGLVSLS